MQEVHLGLVVAADQNSRAALAIAKEMQGEVARLQQDLGQRDSVIAQLQAKVADLEHQEVLRRAVAMEQESRRC